ncbi:MAG: CRTAC1 family protein [Planctomycetales bacterium]|nr:CRTAC1 family protein [Planctomycetales bacterium]
MNYLRKKQLPTFVRLTLIAITLASGCNREPGSGESTPATGAPSSTTPWFTDVTRESKLNFSHVRNTNVKFWLPEITGGGGGWIDFDNDGDSDLYLVQSGELNPAKPNPHANQLWENLGNGTFQDVTDQAGVGDHGYGMGLAVGDYNGDGWEDLYVTNVGPNVLYRNNADGTFTDVTAEAKVDVSAWSSSAMFVDYDDDGDLDLFVANYIRWSPASEVACFNGRKEPDYCAPAGYNAPTVDRLFRNDANGSFTDVTESAGLSAAFGNGLGVAAADFNLDGRLDFYVANDGNPNQLWIQNENHQFTDQALLSGCAVNRSGAAEAGMGVAPVDLDHDGDCDLFMTHLMDESNTLYMNQNGVFDDASAASGLAAPSLQFTGFGMGFHDFNHDGRLDLFVANGRVTHALNPLSDDDTFAEPNQLFSSQADGTFQEVMPRGGLGHELIETSRAAAFADYDLDGDVDIMVVNSGGTVRLLRNDAGAQGDWIRFRILNASGHDAVGARVCLTTNKRTCFRIVQRAYSYLASNEPEVDFGLEQGETVTDVTVIWPNLTEQSFGSKTTGQRHRLVQAVQP